MNKWLRYELLKSLITVNSSQEYEIKIRKIIKKLNL